MPVLNQTFCDSQTLGTTFPKNMGFPSVHCDHIHSTIAKQLCVKQITLFADFAMRFHCLKKLISSTLEATTTQQKDGDKVHYKESLKTIFD